MYHNKHDAYAAASVFHFEDIFLQCACVFKPLRTWLAKLQAQPVQVTCPGSNHAAAHLQTMLYRTLARRQTGSLTGNETLSHAVLKIVACQFLKTQKWHLILVLIILACTF